jgi:hypothetical protein
MYSPALMFMQDIQRIKSASAEHNIVSKLDESMFQIEGFPGAAKAWIHLQKACRFHWNDKLELRDKQLEYYYKKTGFRKVELNETAINFVKGFIGAKGRQDLEGLATWTRKLQINFSSEMDRYRQYHNAELAKERYKEYIDVISNYFLAHHEYEQTITYARFKAPIVNGAVATSINFDATKMFYGSAFEMYGDHLDLLAALNNIYNNRPYDKMLNIDMTKYRQTDKARRPDCLNGMSALDFSYDEYDNSLRNASHHRWFRISEDRRKIEYRKGGTGDLYTLTYAEYTYRCNRLLIQLLILFAFEIEFFSLLG